MPTRAAVLLFDKRLPASAPADFSITPASVFSEDRCRARLGVLGRRPASARPRVRAQRLGAPAGADVLRREDHGQPRERGGLIPSALASAPRRYLRPLRDGPAVAQATPQYLLAQLRAMQASVRARAAGAGAGFVMEMDVDVQRPSGSLHLDFLDGFTRCAARLVRQRCAA